MAGALDVLAIGAHPDDVELGCAGTLLKLGGQGYSAGILDLTRGELGSRGTPEQRLEEAAQAARILNAERLQNLELSDGNVLADSEVRDHLIRIIRSYRPRLILTHDAWGHPDHHQVFRLVTDAAHHAGLAKINTGQPTHRPDKLAYWLEYTQPTVPDVVVDISAEWEAKEAAVRAYRSQLHEQDSDEPETYLSRVDFLDQIRSQNRHYGNLAKCDFGEGYRLSRLPRPADLIEC